MIDGLLAVTGIGTCTVTVSQAGDQRNEPAPPVVRTTTVAKRPQVVSLSAVPAVIRGIAQVPVTATSDVGDSVTITASGACTFADGQASVVDVGTCTVIAATPGDGVTRSAVADGSAALTGVLPALSEGTHRLVASGVALDGSVVEETLAFGVAQDGTIAWIGTRPALASTGVDLAGAGILAALWVLLGAGLVATRRAGRREQRVLSHDDLTRPARWCGLPAAAGLGVLQ